MNNNNNYREFDFGFAEARVEVRKPTLLREGYYDLDGNEEKILRSHEYVVLGYKGAGKSMVGARLATLAEDSPTKYVVGPVLAVDQVPLPSFRDMVPDTFDAQLRYQHAWSLLLYAELIERLIKDGSAEDSSRMYLEFARAALSEAGVIPSSPETLRRLKKARVSHKYTVPKLYERTETFEPHSQAHAITIWLNTMKTACEQFKSTRKHFLIVDGLDDLRMVSDEANSLILGGLLQAAATINDSLQSARAPVKVFLCIRTDMYGRLPTPRKGKIRRDFGLELNWYQNPRDFAGSHLIHLANQRARITQKKADLFRQYFPPTINGAPTPFYLLENTRQTPRDVLQLLKIIQRHVKSDGPLSIEAILGGLGEYSKTYFIDELDDAMSPYFDSASRTAIKGLLGKIRRRSFMFKDLEAEARADPKFKRLDIEAVITALFDTGFVGNKTAGGATGLNEFPYYRFKYRSHEATLRLDEEIVFHLGLWKALDIG